LFIDFERGSTFTCGLRSKAYDVETKKWRHLDFWDWKNAITTVAQWATIFPKNRATIGLQNWK
jgi:hypothetical protein